jgi:regulator of protease activity HflC (stomatin/prohibitin superfamily)
MGELATALLIAVVVIGLFVLLSWRKVTMVYPPNVGLLYRDGRFVRVLEPGRHAMFDPQQRTHIVQVSQAPLPVQLAELTVMSKDQFSFRIGLAPVVEVADPRAFMESQGAVEPARTAAPTQMRVPMPPPVTRGHASLHALAASAALEVAAASTLREIFADPQRIIAALQDRLATAIPGARVTALLLTAMTLPPETRKMFTEVERSRMEGEAALERARSEQASLRALANAARLIKDNPALANLRFLQMVEQTSGPKTIVMGNAVGFNTSEGTS